MKTKYIEKETALRILKSRLIESALNNIGIKADVDEVFCDIAENRLPVWMGEIADADVVSVLRCRDCKHSGYQYRDSHDTEKVVCWKDGYGIHKNANGYCDDGDFRD